MKLRSEAIIATVWLLAGCRSAHDVAETSYQTATAPNNIVSPQPGGTTTTVTTTNPNTNLAGPPSAVSSPQSVPPPPVSENTTSTYTEQRRPPATEPRPAPAAVDFPTAKPVEGKPGYVYSPFDPSKYVDVSGYAPGSKVKDPYSGKIFLVP